MKKPSSEGPPQPETKAQTSDESSKKSDDVVVVHGVTDDRQGLRVLRARNETVEVGEVRPLVDGQAITGDVVKLRPRKEAPFVCDVETAFSTSQPSTKSEGQARPTQAGPAQVASDTYRENWDAIWASKISSRGSDELN